MSGELRLWSVDVSTRSTSIRHVRNKTVYVGAPSLVEAIQAALEEFDPDDQPWAVSAGHKGPIQRIVESDSEGQEK